MPDVHKGFDIKVQTDKIVKEKKGEEDDLKLVLDSFTYSKSYFAIKHIAFREFNDLYRQVPAQKQKFRANLIIPLIYPIISTILPRMVSNLPKFRYEPREESDSKAIDQMSKLVDYQLDRMDFFRKLKMWVKDTLIFGTGLVKVYWRRDDEEEYNDPDLELVDILDFFPDPKSVEIDSGDFSIHRTIVGINTLKNQKGPNGKKLYKNLDKISDTSTKESPNRNVGGSIKGGTWGDVDSMAGLGSPFINSTSKQVELLEYWGINPNEKDQEWVITVANRNTVIRSEKNPFSGRRPFIKMHIDPVNHEFNGIGAIEPIKHLQYELNDTRNQRIDNVNLILNKMFIILRGGNIDKQDLISRPGGIIEEDIPGAVRILETPDVTASAYQEEAIIKQDAQNTVGVTDIIQGQLRSASENVQGTQLNQTARGAQIAVEQAGSRFKYYLQNIEDALREFGLVLFEYNQQFLDEEKVIRVEAPNDYQSIKKTGLVSKIKEMVGMKPEQAPQFQFVQIDPRNIKNLKLDVKVEAGSTQPLEENIKQQKVVNLISMLSALPVTTPDTYIVLAERILDAFNVTNKDDILKTLQVPQGKGPEAKINVSLKGDLNPYQAADIAQIAGASPQSSDPKLTSEMMAQQKKDELVKSLIKDAGKFGNKSGAAGSTPNQS